MGAGDNKTLPERARAEALAEWVLSFRDDAEENEGYGAFYVRGDKTLHGGDPRHYLPTHPFPDSPFKADLRVLCTVYLAAEARVEAVEAERDEARGPGRTLIICHAHDRADRAEKARDLAEARVVALEEALRDIEKSALLGPVNTIDLLDFVQRALASSVKQEKEGLGGQRSALSRAQEDQP